MRAIKKWLGEREEFRREHWDEPPEQEDEFPVVPQGPASDPRLATRIVAVL